MDFGEASMSCGGGVLLYTDDNAINENETTITYDKNDSWNNN